MTNFRSAAIATGNAIDESAYDNVKIVSDNIADVVNVSGVLSSGGFAGVADNVASIGSVASNIADVVTTAGLEVEIQSIATDKVTLDSLYTDKATLDSIFADKSKLDSLVADKTALDSLYADKSIFDRVYASIANIDTVSTQEANITNIANNVVPNMAEILLADDNAATATTKALEADAAATAALASETAAGLSETNAATSESNAATSASEAQTFRDEVALIYDQFDDRYLGAKTVDPTLDNDGNVLAVGALYYNTTTKEVRFWDGTTWDRPEYSASQSALIAQGYAESAEADAIQVAANLVSTNQDTIDTAADRVQTGLDAASTAADVLATAADRAATAQDAIDTAADAAQTALDRIATGNDVTATNADVVITNADVVQTNLDKVATAADRVQTSLDATATSADLLATNQDVLDTAANVVLTNADVVTTGNNATAAQTAQGLAEAARDAAQLAETNAVASADFVDDLVLGAKAVAPTVDNDGGVLQVGAIYYDISIPGSEQLKIWDGTAWQVTVFDTSGVVTSFNGREGTVTLTTADVNTALGFTAVELTKINVDALGINAGTVNSLTVETAVPVGALFTDTNTETTTTLSLSTNILRYVDELGATTALDLSLYLDDTNLAYIASGALNGTTGIATFTRDDASTFTVDLSALLDDTSVTVNDTLISISTTEALSANQGKVLKGLADGLETRVALNDVKVSNVNHPLVETAVPLNALFTDTVYDSTAIDAAVALNTAKISFDSTSSTRLANTSGNNTGDQDLSGYSLTSHTHTGTYEPADATILKDADIGTTIQAYSANTTLKGNTFNGNSQLVETTADGKLPVIDGSNLTGISQDLSGLMVKTSNLSDVASQQTALNNITAAGSATNEYVLTKDTATGNAVFKASVGGGASTLVDLTDTTISTPTDAQVLTYDTATSKWINADATGGAGGGIGEFKGDSIAISSVGATLANDDGTSNDNIGIGDDVLTALTTQINNVAIGKFSCKDVISNSNVGIGYLAGVYISSGSNNIAVGANALQGAVSAKLTGSYNIGIGSGTGDKLTTGQYNVLNGYQAGYGSTTSSFNVMIGDRAGKLNTSGGSNVLIGEQTGYNFSTGSRNTVIGQMAGWSANGSLNVFLGTYAGYSETGSSKLHIGTVYGESLIQGDFLARTLQVNGSLDVEAITVGGAAIGGGGAMELISTQVVSASVASVEFTGLTTYDRYEIRFALNSVAKARMQILLSVDNGVSFITTGYDSAITKNGVTTTTAVASVPYIDIGGSAYYQRAGVIELENMKTTDGAIVNFRITGSSGVGGVAALTHGTERLAAQTLDIDAIQILTNLNTFDSGEVSLYGIKG